VSKAWPRRPMAEVAPLMRRPVEVDVEAIYREIGIRSFAKGVFHKPPISGLELGDKRVFNVKPGDLLFNIVFAWEGAVAVASDGEDGTIGSHRFLTCVPNPDLADPHFLFWWFSHGEGREQLLRASPGGAGRNRTLGVDKLAAIQVPMPSLAEQRLNS
jgi:type I restriction enzyme S subunit